MRVNRVAVWMLTGMLALECQTAVQHEPAVDPVPCGRADLPRVAYRIQEDPVVSVVPAVQPGELDLLDGRLLARFPPGTVCQTEEGQREIPCGGPRQDLTRVAVTAGAEQMVAVFRETYTTEGHDLTESVRRVLHVAPGAEGPRVVRVAAGDPALHVVQVTPGASGWHGQPGEVSTLFVGSADTTVQDVRCVMSPQALATDCAALGALVGGEAARGGCAAVVTAMVRTLRHGRRPVLDRQGGVVRPPGGPVAVALPPGWYILARRHGDRVAYVLAPMNPLGTDQEGLGITLGAWPVR